MKIQGNTTHDNSILFSFNSNTNKNESLTLGYIEFKSSNLQQQKTPKPEKTRK